MRELQFRLLQVPFKEKFTHHTASREKSETFLVIASEGLEVGYGEGCPRIYVTGETLKSCEDFFSKVRDELKAIRNLEELRSFVQKNEKIIDKNPSAWCAIELALLDLFSRKEDKTIENYLGFPKETFSQTYTAVIGIESFPKFVKKALLYRFLRFKDFKIKISGHFRDDERALTFLHLLGVDRRNVRIDGNNLWSDYSSALNYLGPLKKKFWAIEEPLGPFDYDSMIKLSQNLECKIILDESFLNQDHLELIKSQPKIFYPNLRLSKLGGLLRSMNFYDQLKNLGFSCIVGSHVGETSLLTRASLLLSKAHAREGGFSTYLLSEDPFYPNLKLHFGGQLPQKTISQKGFGMSFKLKKDV